MAFFSAKAKNCKSPDILSFFGGAIKMDAKTSPPGPMPRQSPSPKARKRHPKENQKVNTPTSLEGLFQRQTPAKYITGIYATTREYFRKFFAHQKHSKSPPAKHLKNEEIPTATLFETLHPNYSQPNPPTPHTILKFPFPRPDPFPASNRPPQTTVPQDYEPQKEKRKKARMLALSKIPQVVQARSLVS